MIWKNLEHFEENVNIKLERFVPEKCKRWVLSSYWSQDYELSKNNKTQYNHNLVRYLVVVTWWTKKGVNHQVYLNNILKHWKPIIVRRNSSFTFFSKNQNITNCKMVELNFNNQMYITTQIYILISFLYLEIIIMYKSVSS